MPLMKATKRIITCELNWSEIYPLIHRYIWDTYESDFPPGTTRVRVLNKAGTMVKPDRIQFKYTEEE